MAGERGAAGAGRKTAFAVAAWAIFTGPGAALGADPPVSDLSGQVMVKQSFQHESNPLLMTSGAKAVNGSVTSPEFILNGDAPARHLDWDNRVDFNEFDLHGFSSTDVHSTGHLGANGETWQATLGAGLDYDTTRTSETASSGVNVAGIRHTGFSFSPQAVVNLSELSQIQLNASYARHSYANTALYTDYETFGVAPTYQYNLSPLDTAQFQLQAARYQSLTGPSLTIDNAGPSFGWIHRLSERFTLSGSVGGQETMYHYGAGAGLKDTSSLDPTFACALRFEGQQDTIRLSAVRQSQPNGNGNQSLATIVNFSETHMMTQRFGADLTASYQTYDYTGGNAAANASLQDKYAAIAPRIFYHLTEELVVDFTYQYRQKHVIGGQSAMSNAVMFNFVYRPKAKALLW